MATSVQTPNLLSQACLTSANQIAVSPSPNTPSIALTTSPLSGSDVVNIMIAISVLIGVILRKSTQSK